ncbi:CPBP family intramembrane glutamic endopeptidase [Roseivirga sp. E12]|uniref:CPBP family intramembrane glutamic endopeptidase n=1 Tax=Roseivirga sp. E12 TaxID=2819237 RepID=UPI001ABC1D5D|nr:type II CAAX endopeptidase family protein [Roseivirga sp. E12]MBO3699255.1 CPBP family intramembrane metalloprotease [Roseivirga sp. E12]
MKRLIKKYPVLAFAAIVLLPVHGILWPLRLSGVGLENLQGLKLLFALIPSIGALIITNFIEGEHQARKLWQRVYPQRSDIKIYLVALVSITGIGSLAVLVRFVLDGLLPSWGSLPSVQEAIFLLPFLLFFPGFTEEFGWRGFMQQKLQKRNGVFLASLMTGLVWGGWHCMDFLLGNWPAGTFNVLLFFAYITGTSIVIGGLYAWSKGSVAVAILAHFSANMVNFFLPVWNNEAGTKTPIIFISLLWAVAFVILAVEVRRSKKIQRPNPELIE